MTWANAPVVSLPMHQVTVPLASFASDGASDLPLPPPPPLLLLLLLFLLPQPVAKSAIAKTSKPSARIATRARFILPPFCRNVRRILLPLEWFPGRRTAEARLQAED